MRAPAAPILVGSTRSQPSDWPLRCSRRPGARSAGSRVRRPGSSARGAAAASSAAETARALRALGSTASSGRPPTTASPVSSSPRSSSAAGPGWRRTSRGGSPRRSNGRALGPLDGVVAVPAAPLRLRARGYDSGELIARHCADLLGLPLAPCLARRTDRRQVGRGRAERLAARPRIRATGPVPGRALLIDDVMTTGSTLAAAAAVLREAGCERVEGAVFAHTARIGRGPLYTRRTI